MEETQVRAIDYCPLYTKSQEKTEGFQGQRRSKNTSSKSYTLLSEVAQLKHC